MLCTDIHIETGVPEQAFVVAWNHLVGEKDSYLPEWRQAMNSSDLLKVYRARELICLVEDAGYITTMPYELMLKTLNHIEVGFDGKLVVVFLAGVRI